ncbi:MAG: hypothetical protein EOO61_05260 [Hymenobacter sp.]|nr:MAG: hypothetical protein EOO61_05260 [Hymenobacter sp.]
MATHLLFEQNYLRFFLAGALKKSEVFIFPDNEDFSNISLSEKKLIDDLDCIEKNYLDGIFSVSERENNKLDRYKYGFYRIISEGKWQKFIR